ncbi:elongation factor 1-delta isoform X2 [Emydura macquarii macquarii]|uniref:elongation factor 1-delta isoform X2 n=1 Tax=Emydura macquarii macquarii TaxID=1129001 RepID=UPI00352B3A43
MATNFLMHEKIWFDKFKYDDAERRYYEQMNGPVASPSCKQRKTVSNSPQEVPPAQPKRKSGHLTSASTTSSPGPGGDQNELVTRIANLEVENQNLRSVVADLQLAISKLETRLNVLEKSSTSHHPSPTPPTQHVIPMKVESRVTPPKKVELPSASPAMKGGPSEADEDEDDDIDLFGSDNEEEDQEAAKVREERLRQYAEKKSKKPGLIAKSSILLDVKPWDDETDMAKMEECVRSIQMDGLVWGASKLVPVGYGIKKLQIQCIVEDDKVGTDILEEEITKFEDYVQSVDIAAFNKI